MTPCPYSAWAFLPLELRRRLRLLYLMPVTRQFERIDADAVAALRSSAQRLAHLTDSPRCTMCRQEMAA